MKLMISLYFLICMQLNWTKKRSESTMSSTIYSGRTLNAIGTSCGSGNLQAMV